MPLLIIEAAKLRSVNILNGSIIIDFLYNKLQKVNQRFYDEHSRDGSGTAAKRRYSVQPDTEVEASDNAHASNASTCL